MELSELNKLWLGKTTFMWSYPLSEICMQQCNLTQRLAHSQKPLIEPLLIDSLKV